VSFGLNALWAEAKSKGKKACSHVPFPRFAPRTKRPGKEFSRRDRLLARANSPKSTSTFFRETSYTKPRDIVALSIQHVSRQVCHKARQALLRRTYFVYIRISKLPYLVEALSGVAAIGANFTSGRSLSLCRFDIGYQREDRRLGCRRLVSGE
jgi:hypothetical protein